MKIQQVWRDIYSGRKENHNGIKTNKQNKFGRIVLGDEYERADQDYEWYHSKISSNWLKNCQHGDWCKAQRLTFANLFSSIQQEASESVRMLFLTADITSSGQDDIHPVSSLQLNGHDNAVTVYTVLAVLSMNLRHNLAVNL